MGSYKVCQKFKTFSRGFLVDFVPGENKEYITITPARKGKGIQVSDFRVIEVCGTPGGKKHSLKYI